MSREELLSRVAYIKKSSASALDCSSATVEELSALLSSEPAKGAHTIAPINGSCTSKTRNAVPRVGRTPVARSKKKPEVDILEARGHQKQQLSSGERLRLATEVVNSTLKGLTEVIKAPPASKPHRKTKPLSRTSSSSQVGGLDLNTPKPLHPRCVNQMSDTPGTKNGSRRSSSVVSDQRAPGTLALAECARIAFMALRKLDVQNELSTPHLQLETGMSALINKLIALGLDELAIKEILILSKRLCLPSSTQSAVHHSRKLARCLEPEMNPSKQTLTDLLFFSKVTTDPRLLSLMIELQLQVLKIIAIRKRVCNIEAALEHVKVSTGYSPTNLIELTISSSTAEARNKAARQLETLAQVLLSLCSSSSQDDDESTSGPRRHARPHIVFQYQMLVLEVQTKMWKYSGHQTHVQRNLLGPFAKYLRTFIRRSTLSESDTYTFASSAIEQLSEAIPVLPVISTPDTIKQDTFVEIYRIIADLARKGQNFSAAASWMARSTAILDNLEASLIQKCGILCQTASIQLQDSWATKCFDSDDVVVGLRNVANALKGSLQGDSAELDELLMYTVELRKHACSGLFESTKLTEKEGDPQISSYQSLCLKIVWLCARYLARYLGQVPERAAGSKATLNFQRRLDHATRVASSTIEAVASLSRLPFARDPEMWTMIDKGLHDCTQITEVVESCADQTTAAPPGRRSARVVISNAYWYHYLSEKGRRNQSAEMKTCLKKSIDLLRNQSATEKIAGLLSIKLEKLGESYEASDDVGKARQLYMKALQAHIETGLLCNAAEAAATKSLGALLKEDTSAKSMGRLLSSYLRVTQLQQVDHSEFIFDDVASRVVERGLLLELQLANLSSSIRDQKVAVNTELGLQALSHALLELYSVDEYPVRRLRVCVNLLHIQHIHQLALTSTSYNQIRSTVFASAQPPHADNDMIRFVPHLLARQEAYIAIAQDPPNISAMQHSIDIWRSLVRECRDWSALQNQIDEIPAWLGQLNAVSEYLDLQGLGLQRASLLQLVTTVHELRSSPPFDTLVSDLVALGLQQSRLGYSGRAGSTMQKARKHLDSMGVSHHVLVQWDLAYAEYLLLIGNIDKCEQHTTVVKTSLELAMSATSRDSDGTDQRYNRIKSGADLSNVLSLQSLARNCPSEALLFARRSVQLSYKLWAVLKRRNELTSSRHLEATSSDVDLIADEIAVFSLSHETTSATAKKCTPSSSATFWPLIPVLFSRLLHLSRIYAHEGMLPEAEYYAEQAQHFAKSANAVTLEVQVQAILGDYHIRRGQSGKGMALLAVATQNVSEDRATQACVTAQMALASCFSLSGDHDDAMKALEHAQQLISVLLSEATVHIIDGGHVELTAPVLRMERLSIQAKVFDKQPTKGRSHHIKSQKNPKSGDVGLDAATKIAVSDYFPLQQLRAQVLRQSAQCALRATNLELAHSYTVSTYGLPTTQQDLIHQALIMAQLSLSDALENISRDPVLNILPESTMSCPSAAVSCRRRSKEFIGTGKGAGAKTHAMDAKSKAPQRIRERKIALESCAINEKLCKAFAALDDVHKRAQSACSLPMIHQLSDVFLKTIMTLSAVCPGTSQISSHSILAAYALELGRSSATRREKSAIDAEKQLIAQPKSSTAVDLQACGNLDQRLSNSVIDFATFQSNYIDIIPTSWTVLTMAISESRNELRLTKLRPSQAPFVLVIPLSRHSPGDGDEDVFEFDQGKAELLDIIKTANFSAHEARDMSKKGAKTEWWAARAALDARLKDLLTNIENIWFGGFRGTFSQLTPRQDLLSRFQQSFTNILNKHLPSRQKASKQAMSARVVLDARVLEIFVGLGDPAQNEDLDEPLMDLLYFVIDILQFNGERNAYDEIEFDAIAVETLDALVHYHQAAREDMVEGEAPHTILILDKALHCFPWESLPCMSGQAISRLPSLASLRTRILQQKEESERHYIDSTDGAYILNPSGDLQSTQDTFRKPLTNLTDWSGIIKRVPSEDEIATLLSTRSLYLYFGHGSGGQYIRSLTIKRLDQCAVALLMGCSSAALTEEGEFESHGMPMNYLQGGAPAVVGTLWDVTDKDIDRFSMTLLERWGLFEGGAENESVSPVKKGLRGKSRIRTEERKNEIESRPNAKGTSSLDQAVAAGRDSCIMRYLNGAAPVVYGIPVYLK